MPVNGEVPAVISEADWDTHSGELARVSGIVNTLRDDLVRTNRNLSIIGGEMKSLGPRLESLDRRLRERDARLDSLNEWKEDTGRHELARLEKELDDTRAEAKRRFWFWAKIVGGVVVALGDAAVHWLQAVR